MISIGELIGELKLIDNFTKPLQAAMFQIGQAGDSWQKAGARMSETGMRMTAGITVPLVALGGAAVKAASDFESSFAGVRKTVDATEEQFAELATGIREMAKAGPTGTDTLNQIAEAAGQLGIKRDAILGFTRTVADLAVTTNLTADDASNALARIANVTGLAQDEFDRLGAAIVALGNAGASTESEIVDFSLRIAGAGEIAGLTEAQILAIGSAMTSVGVEAEAGGTAVQKVLISMTKAVVDGGEELKLFADAAGLEAGQFADMWENDAMGAFTAFVEGLGEQGSKAFATLDELGLKDQRLIRSFLSLSQAGDLLAEQVDIGTKAFADNVALVNEAQKRYETFESQLRMFWNQLKDVAITLGTALLPSLRDALQASKPLIDMLASMAQGFAELPQGVRTTALAFGALAAAAGPALAAFGLVAQGAGAAAAAFTKLGVEVSSASLTAGLSRVGSLLMSPVGIVAGLAALIVVASDVDLGNVADGAQEVATNFAKWVKETDLVVGAMIHLENIMSAWDAFLGPHLGKIEEWQGKIDGLNRAYLALQTGGISELLKWLDRVGGRQDQMAADTDRETKRATAGWAAQEDAVENWAAAIEAVGPNYADFLRLQAEGATVAKQLSKEEKEAAAEFAKGIQHQIDVQVLLSGALTDSQRSWIEFADAQGLTVTQMGSSSDAATELVRRLFTLDEASQKAATAQKVLADKLSEAGKKMLAILEVRDEIAWVKQLNQAAVDGSAAWYEYAKAHGLTIQQATEIADPLAVEVANLFNLTEAAKGASAAFSEFDESMRNVEAPPAVQEFADTFLMIMEMSGEAAEVEQTRLENWVKQYEGALRSILDDEQWRLLQDQIASMVEPKGFNEKFTANMQSAVGDITQIFLNAFDDIVSGAKSASQMMGDIFVAALTVVGAAIGGAIGGAPGAQAGATIGGLVGGLFGGGGTKPYGGVDFGIDEGLLTVLSEGKKNHQGSWEEMDRFGQQLADAINDIFAGFGGVLTGLNEDIGFILKNGANIVNINGVQKNFGEDFQAALEFFILETIKAAEFTGLSPEVTEAIRQAAEQAGNDFDAFTHDLAAIKEFQNISLPGGELAGTLEDLRRHFDDLAKTLDRLGLDAKVATDEFERQSQALKDAAVVEFGNALLSFVDEYYGKVEGGEEFRLKLEQLQFGIRMASLRMEFEALKAIGALSAEMLGLAEQVFAFIDATPPTFGGGNQDRDERRRANEERREAQREFRDELELLEMATSGASSGMVDLRRRVMELDDYLATQRDAGVRGTDRFRDLSLQSWLDEVMGPINETLANATEAEQVAAHYAEVREQILFIADQMGIAAEPFLAMVDAAEQSDLAQLALDEAEAERELSEARYEGLQALEDLTKSNWSTRLRDIGKQVGDVVTTFIDAMGPAGAMSPEVQGALAAGAAATRALGLDFLGALNDMGATIPGVAEAMIEFNRQQLILAATELFLAGAFADLNLTLQEVIDGVNAAADAQLEAINNVNAAADIALTSARQMREAWEAAEDTFEGLWDQIFGKDIEDPIKVLKQQFRDLRTAFSGMEVFAMKAKLQEMGVKADTWDRWKLIALFKEALKPLEAEEIRKAIEEGTKDGVEDGLAGIRDFFDELRRGGAGLTQTQKFDNVLADFTEAVAAADIETALELARLLTGELGIGQFGSSSDFFADLTSFVVETLGSLLPEGAPPDLVERTAFATERSADELAAWRQQARAENLSVLALLTSIDARLAALPPEAGRPN